MRYILIDMQSDEQWAEDQEFTDEAAAVAWAIEKGWNTTPNAVIRFDGDRTEGQGEIIALVLDDRVWRPS